MHEYIDEGFIVEEHFTDTNLQQSWEKGAYAYCKSGMKHDPFKSEKGYLVFVISSQDY